MNLPEILFSMSCLYLVFLLLNAINNNLQKIVKLNSETVTLLEKMNRKLRVIEHEIEQINQNNSPAIPSLDYDDS